MDANIEGGEGNSENSVISCRNSVINYQDGIINDENSCREFDDDKTIGASMICNMGSDPEEECIENDQIFIRDQKMSQNQLQNSMEASSSFSEDDNVEEDKVERKVLGKVMSRMFELESRREINEDLILDIIKEVAKNMDIDTDVICQIMQGAEKNLFILYNEIKKQEKYVQENMSDSLKQVLPQIIMAGEEVQGIKLIFSMWRQEGAELKINVSNGQKVRVYAKGDKLIIEYTKVGKRDGRQFGRYFTFAPEQENVTIDGVNEENKGDKFMLDAGGQEDVIVLGVVDPDKQEEDETRLENYIANNGGRRIVNSQFDHQYTFGQYERQGLGLQDSQQAFVNKELKWNFTFEDSEKHEFNQGNTEKQQQNKGEQQQNKGKQQQNKGEQLQKHKIAEQLQRKQQNQSRRIIAVTHKKSSCIEALGKCLVGCVGWFCRSV